MSVKFCISLLAFAACFGAINTQTLVTGVTFDSYVQILQATPNLAYQLRILQAVWGQIRAEYPQDVYKITTLYQQFSTLNASQTNVTTQQLQATYELQAAVLQNLIRQSALIVAEIFSEPQLPTGQELDYLCVNVSSKLAGTVAQNIYALAIDEVYNFKDPAQLSAVLLYLNAQCPQTAFEATVQMQLYLYWKFASSGATNEYYLLEVAYVMQQIQNNISYPQLSMDTHMSLNHAINSLPSSLQYLYFQSSFCLLNTQYWEYLYATDSFSWTTGVDAVFTWGVNSTLAPDGAWVGAYAAQLTSGNENPQLIYTFMDQLGQNTLFVEPQIQNYTNIIAVTNSSSADQQWSLQLMNNQLTFIQNGLFMCADDSFYNTNRRYVFAYNSTDYMLNMPACQWIADKCPWQ